MIPQVILWPSHFHIFLKSLQRLCVVECTEIENHSVVSFNKLLNRLIFFLLDLYQLYHIIFKGSANFVHICSKLLILHRGNLQYHSLACPFKVNGKARYLCVSVKPCTPIISLKHLIYTNGSLFF